ncbi:hypothetical protein SEA_BARNSTORMER_35 [Microbacterium phage Barnstormer]|uniref:Uncharacterized protein n=1 Tax=Microbacterium phage Barnstormer TaxID=3028491 RepID=A0AAE9ZNT5_9CAUD|nr:hypothetical protein SEA_BARNSTORMER_35 [Microbacterium phage Barnstormer]WDS52141.1 hypothetical protein SEA_UTZCHIPS_35 [Microbacterium phage UtzChips]
MSKPTVNRDQRVILLALNRLGKHIFAGLESPLERAERRRNDRLDKALAIPGQPRAARRAVTNARKSIARAERRAARKEFSA